MNTTLHIVTQHNTMFPVPILHMVCVDTGQRAGCGSKGQGQVLPVWPFLLVSVWRTRPWLCFAREGLLILHLSFACNTVEVLMFVYFLGKRLVANFVDKIFKNSPSVPLNKPIAETRFASEIFVSLGKVAKITKISASWTALFLLCQHYICLIYLDDGNITHVHVMLHRCWGWMCMVHVHANEREREWYYWRANFLYMRAMCLFIKRIFTNEKTLSGLGGIFRLELGFSKV